MNIMICCDVNNPNEESLRVGMKFGRHSKPAMHLVASLLVSAYQKDYWANIAEKELNRLKRICEKADIPCEIHTIFHGTTKGEALIRFAAEKHMDTVVVGVNSKSTVGKVLFGSTAQYIILHAPCPVISVRNST